MVEPDTAPNKRDLIAGLEKGLAVIEAFDQERAKLSITEVAERAGLTRAAARRYLITLTHLGYVQPDRRMYRAHSQGAASRTELHAFGAACRA